MEKNEAALDQKTNRTLSNVLSQKINDLKALKEALHEHNDLLIYKLLDSNRYHQVIKASKGDHEVNLLALTTDLKAQISHYLSNQLIDYLGQAFPFFYYDEYRLGHFDIYFGNWWDHRKFGKLNALKVEFIYDKTEFNKLKRSFKTEAHHQGFNSKEINQLKVEVQSSRNLLASQNERNDRKLQLREALKSNQSKSRLPWEAQKLEAEHRKLVKRLTKIDEQNDKAIKAKQTIKIDESKILSLAKEEAILGYERQGIHGNFEDFDQFVRSGKHLYRDYIKYLAKEAKVNKHAE